LSAREKSVGQLDAMIAIADPIHELQGAVIEGCLCRVILDENEFTGDTRGIAEHRKRIARMMQDIDKHADVKGAVLEWQTDAVKADAGDGALWAREEFSAGDAEAGNGLSDETRDGSIAAPNVEQSG